MYKRPYGYHYAICPKNSNLPAVYIHAGTDGSHDLGYGLLKEFRHRGFATEAARAVVARLKKDGMPYITATHDIRNPRSGGVMKQLGMRY
ncbi:MAG: GNAT family N-acetyltransferase [Akkermansia muciniphila]